MKRELMIFLTAVCAVTTLNTQWSLTGNSGNAIMSIGGQVSWTALSDKLVKKNIKENVPGLSFIKLLRPVTYHLDIEARRRFINSASNEHVSEVETRHVLPAQKEIEEIVYTGFLAQDVKAAAKSLRYNFSGVDDPKNDKNLYGLRYEEFVVPLVKALQELSFTNNKLKTELTGFVDILNSIRKQISILQTEQQKTL